MPVIPPVKVYITPTYSEYEFASGGISQDSKVLRSSEISGSGKNISDQTSASPNACPSFHRPLCLSLEVNTNSMEQMEPRGAIFMSRRSSGHQKNPGGIKRSPINLPPLQTLSPRFSDHITSLRISITAAWRRWKRAGPIPPLI